MITAYKKIYALDNSNCDIKPSAALVLQEKIDGSQISFGLIDGELQIRSKNVVLERDNKDFALALERVYLAYEEISPYGLFNNKVFRGEFLRAPKHNVIQYDRAPEGNIAVFDIFDIDYGKYIDIDDEEGRDNFSDLVEYILGFECVHPIATLPPLASRTLEDVEAECAKYSNAESRLGGKMEGIVVKKYGEGGHRAAKYVFEEYKEIFTKKRDTKKKKQVVDFQSYLHHNVNKEAVWQKAVQHLRDDGELNNDNSDIGKLLKEMNIDFMQENEEDLKEAAWKWGRANTLKHINYGFADWYKSYLSNAST